MPDCLSALHTGLRRRRGAPRTIALACFVLVVCIAGITLAEYMFEWNAGLDELLIRVPMANDVSAPGRMSWVTA